MDHDDFHRRAQEKRDFRKKVKIGVWAGSTLVGLILLFTSFGHVYVEGSERVVWQTFSGVREDVGLPGLNFYFGWTTTPHKYYTGSDTFIIDKHAVNANNSYMDAEERSFNEPDMPPVTIPVQMDKLTKADIEAGKTTGPTDIKLACVMQYHIDPTKLVKLHNEKTKGYRTTFLKDILTTELIEQTTVLDARTVYQGSGRVELQNVIEANLKNNERLKGYGVIVEKFVIRQIELLDKDFLKKITEEARAEQNRKTAAKQEVAYQAQARAEKARALAEQNRRLVEAETKKQERIAKAEGDKQEQILRAQAKAEQVKLAAEAEKEENRLQGEGLKLRKVAEAEGVLALGKAQAEAKELMLKAYVGQGGQRFAQVEIAKAMGKGIQKIYYVPSDMNITTLAKDFNNAIAIGLPKTQAKVPTDSK